MKTEQHTNASSIVRQHWWVYVHMHNDVCVTWHSHVSSRRDCGSCCPGPYAAVPLYLYTCSVPLWPTSSSWRCTQEGLTVKGFPTEQTHTLKDNTHNIYIYYIEFNVKVCFPNWTYESIITIILISFSNLKCPNLLQFLLLFDCNRLSVTRLRSGLWEGNGKLIDYMVSFRWRKHCIHCLIRTLLLCVYVWMLSLGFRTPLGHCFWTLV